MSDHARIFDAVKAYMDDRPHIFTRDAATGGYSLEVYADYRDELDDDSIVKIMNADNPRQALAEYLYSAYAFSIDEEYGDIAEQIRETNLWDEDDVDAYEVEDVLRDILDIMPPMEHFLHQDVFANIFIDTGDGNYDFVLNTHYPAWDGSEGDFEEKASLTWLAGTQGYDRKTFSDAINNGEDEKEPEGFLRSVYVELANVTSHMNMLAFLIKTDLSTILHINELIKNKKSGSITVSKDTICGLYDAWNGGGSVFDIQLEKQVEIPLDYIRSFLPDGGDGHSIESVYGMCGSAWERGTMKIKEEK